MFILWLHGVQHIRLPGPSLLPRVCSSSCPLRPWCHPTFSSCFPLLLLPSVFPSMSLKKKKKESFPVSQLFILVLELHLQHQSFQFRVDFLLGLTGLISLLFRGLSRIFASTTVQKHKFFSAQPFMVRLSHPYMTTGKTNSFNYMNLYSKVMSLLFNMLSRLVILVIKKKISHAFLSDSLEPAGL